MPHPTRTLVVLPDAPDPDAVGEAAGVIRRGGLVAFATETVYGLGADATSADAVRRIFAAKALASLTVIALLVAGLAASSIVG